MWRACDICVLLGRVECVVWYVVAPVRCVMRSDSIYIVWWAAGISVSEINCLLFVKYYLYLQSNNVLILTIAYIYVRHASQMDIYEPLENEGSVQRLYRSNEEIYSF